MVARTATLADQQDSLGLAKRRKFAPYKRAHRCRESRLLVRARRQKEKEKKRERERERGALACRPPPPLARQMSPTSWGINSADWTREENIDINNAQTSGMEWHFVRGGGANIAASEF